MGILDGILNFGRNAASAATEAVNPGEYEGTSSGVDLAQDKYDFEYLVFPDDLGMENVGHYMVININVPTMGVTTGTNVRTAAGRYAGKEFNVVTSGNMQSKVDTLRFGARGGVGTGRSAFEILPRQTRRIKESIALFMPQGLFFNSENAYQDVSLAAMAGKLPIAGTVLGALAGETSSTIFKNPINPAIEVTYNSTLLRSFTFEFNFAPRNEKESLALRTIIKTLRFHAAPEINGGPGGVGMGLTWIPPAEFDITFFNKGKENFAIPRINTCVLRRIDVDYHPAGRYSTFRNGHPVAVRMILLFQEVEIIHKQRVNQDF